MLRRNTCIVIDINEVERKATTAALKRARQRLTDHLQLNRDILSQDEIDQLIVDRAFIHDVYLALADQD